MPASAPILVARLRLTVAAAVLDAAATLVDAAERDRAARFVHAADRARHLLGRALARRLVGERLGASPAALRLVEDANGKPAVAAAAAPSFNLSHSGDWIVCALVDAGPVGVDVQQAVPSMARPDDFGPVFGPRERARIDAAGGRAARIDAFARAWARKEALVKAVGLGLQLKLDSIDIVDGPAGPEWAVPDDPDSAAALDGPWMLRDVAVDATHACAVAWRGARRRVEVVDVDAARLAGGAARRT